MSTTFALATTLAQYSSTSSSFQLGRILGGMLFSGLIGAAIGVVKGRPGLGFVLGAFLGCLGWIITMFVGRKRSY